MGCKGHIMDDEYLKFYHISRDASDEKAKVDLSTLKFYQGKKQMVKFFAFLFISIFYSKA